MGIRFVFFLFLILVVTSWQPNAPITPKIVSIVPSPVATPSPLPTATPTLPPATPTLVPLPFPTPHPSQRLPGVIMYHGSVPDLIRQVFGIYAPGALRVAACESGFNPNATNPGPEHAAGIFQFLHNTWLRTPYANQSPYDANANIHAAYWIFVHDGYSWHEWSCQP